VRGRPHIPLVWYVSSAWRRAHGAPSGLRSSRLRSILCDLARQHPGCAHRRPANQAAITRLAIAARYTRGLRSLTLPDEPWPPLCPRQPAARTPRRTGTSSPQVRHGIGGTEHTCWFARTPPRRAAGGEFGRVSPPPAASAFGSGSIDGARPPRPDRSDGCSPPTATRQARIGRLTDDLRRPPYDCLELSELDHSSPPASSRLAARSPPRFRLAGQTIKIAPQIIARLPPNRESDAAEFATTNRFSIAAKQAVQGHSPFAWPAVPACRNLPMEQMTTTPNGGPVSGLPQERSPLAVPRSADRSRCKSSTHWPRVVDGRTTSPVLKKKRSQRHTAR